MSLSSRVDRVLQGNPEGIQEFQKLSLAEMSETRVTFGKTHVGKTYEEVWQSEKGWVKWFCKVYGDSGKEEHKKFLIFVERKVERLELENELAPLQQTVEQGIVMPRSKAMPKAKATAAHPAEASALAESLVMSEGIWDPWEEMEPETIPVGAQQTEAVEALQHRVLNIENALTEILTLIRPSN